jgi:spore coat protein U-like protein
MQYFAGRWTFASIALLVLTTSGLTQTCTVSLPTIAFGNVNVLSGAAVDTTATVTVSCINGQAVGQRVCISIGAGSDSDVTSRKMDDASIDKVRYDLFKDAARTQLWGSWQTAFDTAGVQLDVPQNTNGSVTVFARFLGSQQAAIPNSYSSTFTANPFVQYGNKTATACPTGGKTASTSTTATATVIKNCTVSATTLNFGSSGVISANIDQTSTIQVQCTNTTPYNVGLNAGTAPGATVTTRKMASGAKQINYSLFRDVGRTTNWGNTVGTDTAASTGTGATQNFTVFGRVPPQTTPAPGAYSDTIVATVTF